MTATSDTAAYLRGKLLLAGLGPDTPVADLCDVLTVLEVDGVPSEQLKSWRDQVDRAAWRIKPPDRASWGLRPDQAAQQQALMGKVES